MYQIDIHGAQSTFNRWNGLAEQDEFFRGGGDPDFADEDEVKDLCID